MEMLEDQAHLDYKVFGEPLVDGEEWVDEDLQVLEENPELMERLARLDPKDYKVVLDLQGCLEIKDQLESPVTMDYRDPLVTLGLGGILVRMVQPDQQVYLDL